MGSQMPPQRLLRPHPGSGLLCDPSRWYRFAQPPANGFDPAGVKIVHGVAFQAKIQHAHWVNVFAASRQVTGLERAVREGKADPAPERLLPAVADSRFGGQLSGDRGIWAYRTGAAIQT
jgi:hypothetical protein